MKIMQPMPSLLCLLDWVHFVPLDCHMDWWYSFVSYWNATILHLSNKYSFQGGNIAIKGRLVCWKFSPFILTNCWISFIRSCLDPLLKLLQPLVIQGTKYNSFLGRAFSHLVILSQLLQTKSCSKKNLQEVSGCVCVFNLLLVTPNGWWLWIGLSVNACHKTSHLDPIFIASWIHKLTIASTEEHHIMVHKNISKTNENPKRIKVASIFKIR